MGHRQRKDLSDAERPAPLRVGARALLLIFGFWTIFAVATAANELVSPFRPRPFREDLVALTFLGAYLWAALTPIAFWFVGRYSLEEGSRPRRVLMYILLAGVLALLVSTVLAFVGSGVVDPSRQTVPESEGGRRPGSPPRMAYGSWMLLLVRYRLLIDLMASLLVVAAALAFDYFRRFQARQAEALVLREQLMESRLQVLRTQLDPHFLFNTLNAVSGLVATDPGAVRRMIARLSDVLRYSLDGARDGESRLGKELDILRRYLEILEIRYQGRLRTEVSAEPDVLDALVPTLILQPLAENAMTHGVARAGGRGRIEVGARRVGDDLLLCVQDTGPGADGGSEQPEERGLGGMGLRHIRQRLDQLYGSAARVQLRAQPEGGMIAEIVLPYHTRATGGEVEDHG